MVIAQAPANPYKLRPSLNVPADHGLLPTHSGKTSAMAFAIRSRVAQPVPLSRFRLPALDAAWFSMKMCSDLVSLCWIDAAHPVRSVYLRVAIRRAVFPGAGWPEHLAHDTGSDAEVQERDGDDEDAEDDCGAFKP